MRILGVFVLLALSVVAYFVGWPKYKTQRDTKAAIAYLLNPSNTNMWYAELNKFPHLTAIPKEIKQVKNLTRVSINGTQISDGSILAEIPALEWVSANMSKIENIAPLASLPNLKALQIHGTPVRDLGPVADMPRLERLDIGNTITETLEPVTRIKNLKWLNLYNGMSYDGSQKYFEIIKSKQLLELSGGNRYAENYMPRR